MKIKNFKPSRRSVIRNLVTVIIGVGLGSVIESRRPTPGGLSRAELRAIAYSNTDAIKELARCAAILFDNSDIIARYSHHTIGHPQPVVMCPECYGTPISATAPQAISQIDKFHGVTSDDLVRDVDEITRAAGSIRNTLFIQRNAILFTLRQLRLNTTKKPSKSKGVWVHNDKKK